jgi:hypothetical protein
MNAKRLMIFGQALLWFGFVVAAFFSVARIEVVDAKWTTVNWTWYLTAIAIGAVGVVLIRYSKAVARSTTAEATSHLTSARNALDQSADRIDQLRSRLENLSCEEVIQWIDSQCVPELNSFADHREAITNRFGTKAFSEVMTEFASGERYLNRAWSAAADGYVDEVAQCVATANTFMNHAKEALDRLMNTESR